MIHIAQVLIIAAAAYCFYRGGKDCLVFRREGVPLLLFGYAIFFSWNWWTLSMFTACGTFALGYGEHSPIRHIFGDRWGRGVWGALSAIALGLWLAISGHMAWQNFAGYVMLAFCAEAFLKDLPQKVGDPIIGAVYGILVLLIK